MEINIKITKEENVYRFWLSDASNGIIAILPDTDFEIGLDDILNQARIFVKTVHKQTKVI